MYQVSQNDYEGWIRVTESPGITFSQVDQSQVISIFGLTNVRKMTTFTYTASNSDDYRYLKVDYRFSRDGINYSIWATVSSVFDQFPLLNPSNNLHLDIRFTRRGSNDTGELILDSYQADGITDRIGTDLTSPIQLTSTNTTMLVKPPYIYKVFSIIDTETILRGDTPALSIKYRISQDNSRTWSDWEYLTTENISTVKISPIRFFQIEYLLEYTGTSYVNIYDINLIGDYQNVTLDYRKTNLMGIREDCNCLKLSVINSPNETTVDDNGNMLNKSCAVGEEGALYNLTDEDRINLFNPYAQGQAMDLLNKMSNDANEIFGHEVVYFITDPDRKGIDYTFNEYQLYNYTCSDKINISVEGNNFPDNQIVFNQFDLTLFENFEVHITKDQFKKVFGPDKRPSKEDFLWFCELNRMYQVEHAQPFRSFNNSAVYYKVMLKKYTQKASVQGASDIISEKVAELTKNSTIDELFGVEKSEDKAAIANKEQFKPLTRDTLRVDINVKIVRELIENSNNIISKSHYELSSLDFGTASVVYRNMKTNYLESDNISYMCWFNIHNYVVNDTYNFFDYYDTVNQTGFKINLVADMIHLQVNTSTYSLPLGSTTSTTADGINEDVWYAYLVNFNQRQKLVSQYLYKRNSILEEDAKNLNSTVLKLVYSSEEEIVPTDFYLEDTTAKILASDMKITNIRLFEDIVEESKQSKILNMAIIREDSKYLVFADNANTRLILPSEDLG